jgi:hypothetical protein
MIGKVKQYLGIEGIKISLEIPEIIDKRKGFVEGNIVLTTKNTQTARAFEIRLIEKYHRGRRKSKLINEYELGRISLKKNVVVSANTTEKIPFKLPFQLGESRMDQMEYNLFLRGLVKIAKFANAVKSEYRLEAEADVVGTALDPSFKQKVIIK